MSLRRARTLRLRNWKSIQETSKNGRDRTDGVTENFGDFGLAHLALPVEREPVERRDHRS